VCFHCRAVLRAITRGTLIASRYEIESPLGRGGMGTVYRAKDRVLDVEVALKVLRSDLPQAAAMQARFRAEIKLARTVSHANVCRIHDYGEEGALRYISMELVDGETLKERVRRTGPLPPAEAVRIAIDVARGLEAIHEAGIVHRDLTPLNVTLDAKGRVRVMDFGIAKLAAGAGDESTPGYFVGNPLYVSPEQARGRPADARSDLYGLGLVLFELLTGRPAFSGDGAVATIYQHLETEPPLSDPAIPPELRPVLARALAKDPDARYASARAMADALAAARPATQPLRTAATAGGRGWIGPAVAALVIATGAVYWLRSASAPPSNEAPVSPAPPTTVEAVVSTTTLETAPPIDPSSSPSPEPPTTTAGPAPPATQPASVPTTTLPSTAPTTTEPAPPSTTLPSPAPPAGTGFLQVGVTPWADIAIDGVIVGQTPMPRLPLSAGTHEVLLSHPDFQPYPRRVTIRAGETLRLIVDLRSDAIRR
jgi:serine/threonine-protein kinase